MKAFRIPLRIVLYRERRTWFAHCLELDLLGHGRSKEAAAEKLGEAIEAQLLFCVEGKGQLFHPAPAEFYEMFASGKDVARAELHLPERLRGLVVEGVTTREYVKGRQEAVEA